MLVCTCLEEAYTLAALILRICILPCSYVDNSQSAADIARTNTLLSSVHKRVVPVIEELEPVLSAFDTSKVRI